MNKAIITFMMLFTFLFANGQSQLENQYFAAWEDIESTLAPPGVYQEPVGSTWATSNGASMSVLDEPSVKKTSDAYRGEYAAFIKTLYLAGRVASGTLFTGKFKLDINFPLRSTKFGIPFTDRPVYLKGFYKYLPVDNDSCRIASWLTKWNSINHKRDTIAAASISHEQSKLTVNTYTEFDIVYNYYSAGSPDSITVIFASSADGANFHGGIGTVLYIDELELGYFPLSLEIQNKDKDVLVYPNPVSEYLTIESTLPIKVLEFKLYNANGNMIKNESLENSVARINLSNLPAGTYFYLLNKSDGKIETGKLIKE